MSGVYNRKLFRQSGARDELRKMGGIMSSSEELMREALRTAMQAPGPSDLGPMTMPRQPVIGMPAPPVMQPQQPMMQPQQPMDMGMQQPMMQQPMDMGMQQPMMQQPMGMGMQQQQQPMDMGMQQPMMQQPMMQPQQPMAEPAFMPPGVPQSAQPQSAGFAEGGSVTIGDLPQNTPRPNRAIGIGPSTVKKPVDIGQTAGTAVAPPTVSADALATAEKLASEVDDRAPEDVGAEIVDTAVKEGAELTGDVKTDLASIYASLTGDITAYEKNIDQLNRGIIGAAIAAGTSARATENIAKGMLVGLESAKQTEERRAGDARALLLAEAQARGKKAGADSESRAYRNPVDAYQDAYQAVMNAGEFDLEVPDGMSREDYADQVATDLIRRSYSADQLVGSPFEGVSAPAAPAAGEVPTQTEADVLQSARAALEAGADRAAVVERLTVLGIDPEKL